MTDSIDEMYWVGKSMELMGELDADDLLRDGTPGKLSESARKELINRINSCNHIIEEIRYGTYEDGGDEEELFEYESDDPDDCVADPQLVE